MPIVSKPRLKSLIDCETVGYSLALKCVVLTQVNSWLYQLYSLRFTCFIDNNFDIFTYVTELYTSRPGGRGDSHMEQTGMLVGNFQFNP